MIGKLKGIIDEITADYVLLDVAGVVYVVFASTRTLEALPQQGEAAQLWIETHVREDHIHLFGFVSQEEQLWFTTLTTVKGVGNKMALGLLSVLSPAQIQTAVAAQDKAAFTQVSGVGTRLAERLLTELKGKVEKLVAGGISDAPEGGKAPTTDEQGAAEDAISALTHLGYNRTQAYQAVHKILAQDNGLKLDDIIKRGLQELAA